MQLQKINDHLYVPENFGRFHHYYADAEGTKEYSGITSIIGVLAKPALIGWAARMATEFIAERVGKYTTMDALAADWKGILEEAKSAHTKKKEAAGEHGTDAHALVEDYVNRCIAQTTLKSGDPLIPFTVDLEPIRPFYDWAVANADHFLFAERRLSDPTIYVAGTADFAYVGKDGKKYMGDFKTSSGIYGIDYWLQVAAYKMLAESEGDEPYDGMMVVRLGKDGKFETQYLYDYETYKNAFLACLTLYRAQAAIKGAVSKGTTAPEKTDTLTK